MAFFAKGLHARRHKTARTVGALLLREMATSYGRSPGGYAWAILEPVAGIALLSIVFSAAFRAPPLGTSFPLFYASGFLPFVFYLGLSSKVAASIQFSKSLLSYPAVTYFDAILARFLLTSLTHIMVFALVIWGIIWFGDMRPILDPFHIINAMCMAAALGLGVGTLNCFLMSMFPIWGQAWAIVNKPLLIISGVLFLFDSIPRPFNEFLVFNPLVHVVGEMRRGFYTNYQGSYIEPLYVYLGSFAAFGIGLLLLNRYNRTILND
ncbi:MULTISPECIES: ABC transporter permease [Falsihalocynthiibacter]|uniref:ABC transporter permease n=1 Tax=Falsihalocynthiibacter TaxID=2854182 RepID=UPI00300224E5